MLRQVCVALALLALASSSAPAQRLGYGGYRNSLYYGNGMYNIGGYPGYYYGGNPAYYGGWHGYPSFTYRPDPAVYVQPSFYYPSAVEPLPAGSGNQPVYVNVQVPADAEVWFAGRKTEQTGATRRFVSPPLPSGYHYVYEVTARWLKDGQPVEQKRTLRFTSGQQSEVNIDLQLPAP